MPLTPEAKKLLAETIRGSAQNPEKGLRARLLRGIHDEADRAYRLSVPIADAGLDEAHRRRRERLEAWVDEQARTARPKGKPATKAEHQAEKARLFAQAEKEAAATFVNRLVLLRHLEAMQLSKPLVLTGGWNSGGYRTFREFAPALCAGVTPGSGGSADATEGYAFLLQLLFDELAVDLPGLFGEVGLTSLFPIPPSALRDIVERLDDPGLACAWTDDTTLGWVYQYWNDPDREALDAKINAGGKIEPHEIASKTQMFTERYMVEWLLQNSLGLTWLCMCKKQGWTADAERVLPVLEARRVDWRARRDSGEVALDALMPIEGELEDHWKYFVPQPLPDDAIKNAPHSVRTLKILDPACGSGHFLVIAFGLLTALYREEAKHRGTTIGDREIAETILENNLFGIDIDPRAIQIAAAAMMLKAKTLAKNAQPKRLNLVAPVLNLGKLPADDPAVMQLRQELRVEAGIPEELTTKLLSALAGVDYLGSLLKVDDAVEKALRSFDVEGAGSRAQGTLFGGPAPVQSKLSLGEQKATVLEKLETFLAKHSKAGDLGLRLDGEQLAAGVRFVRIAKEGTYDVVVGNPPYQGLGKANLFGYVATTYPCGKADLYAAFLERGLGLARIGGLSALLTMRGWMFIGQFVALRLQLLRGAELRLIGDLDRGAFEDVPDEILTTAMSVFRRAVPSEVPSVAIQPTPRDDHSRDSHRTLRKQAAILSQVGRHTFNVRGFEVIDGEPIVYWWSKEFLAKYSDAPKLGHLAPARKGLCTGADSRFIRACWELHRSDIYLHRIGAAAPLDTGVQAWYPSVAGGQGRQWIEPVLDVVKWGPGGLPVGTFDLVSKGVRIQNSKYYMQAGVAFTKIGARFATRVHRYYSVFGDAGPSVFPTSAESFPSIVCSMNTAFAREVLEALNPTVNFQPSDVDRLPLIGVPDAVQIFGVLEKAFSEHEAARETSVEFKIPGPSAWSEAQRWAAIAVDRIEMPPVSFQHEPEEPEATLSFGIGVSLGRFDSRGGISDLASDLCLPAGTLFISADDCDGLNHSAAAPILGAWSETLARIENGTDLRTYLRTSFFDYHRKLYENRPIYFPLSSAKRSFVAFVSIHRWQDDTLSVLLADHLLPTRRRLDGELADLRTARTEAAGRGKAEKRFAEVQKLLEELNDFIAKVTEIADKGAPPPDDKTPRREVDSRYVMDLDDGVMVNSAALWPLLEPQWKDPKKWWKELASAQGKKDYDWSHLAGRYFPTRVRAKCHLDPSLAVAHKCFWELHPAKAYAWEFRLKNEIRPDFTIDEPGSDEARARFLEDHAPEAATLFATEMKRRQRKAAKAGDESEASPLFDAEDVEPGNEVEIG